jgi:L,D-transpeptidase-like protein
MLPIRSNGSTGWVRAHDLTLSPLAFRTRVELRAHRITVFDHDRVRYQGPVAVGAPATPTPAGHDYIRVLIKAPDPSTVYGPYAYGPSSHSDAYATFDGSDAEIGIHGNNDASALGDDHRRAMPTRSVLTDCSRDAAKLCLTARYAADVGSRNRR